MKHDNKYFVELTPVLITDELKVTALYTAYDYHYDPSFKFRGEFHKPWELLFIDAGEVTIYVEDEVIILKPGQAYLHKPYQFHSIKANNVTCRVQITAFDCDSPKLMDIANKPINTSKYQQALMAELIEEGASLLSEINSVPVATANEKPLFANGQITKILLEQLLISLIREKNEPVQRKPKKEIILSEDNLTQMIKQYLQDNEYNKLTLEDIAQYAGYSVPRLCSFFKEKTGVPIMKYFVFVKINAAKKLLRTGLYSIQQISEKLNYDSVQHFSTQFKKVTNLTPSQYKTLQLKGKK